MKRAQIGKIDILTFAKLFMKEDGKPLILEPWQIEKIIKPVFYDVDEEGRRRKNLALIMIPRKNGKSTLSALIAAYGLLADGEPDVEIYSTAGSRDQARIIFNQTVKAISRSPILASEVKIFKDVIERRDGGGIYRVLSADGPLQHGLNAHMVLWDELWVHGNNYELWESLTHSPARIQPLHCCVSYTGFQPFRGNLLFDLFISGQAGTDPGMYFFWSTGPNANLASWITPEYLAQQRSRLPAHIYSRLHECSWTSGEGSLLTPDDIDAATDQDRPQTHQGEDGFSYFMAVDLGLKRDSTGIAVAHNDKGLIVVDHIKRFTAPKGGEVQIEVVEQYIIELSKAFHIRALVFDPWQSASLRQRLGKQGINVEEFTFSGSNWQQLTECLLSLFKDGKIRIPRNDELIKELHQVRVLEKSYGFRLDNPSGTHDDLVVSMGMAALQAVKAGVGCSVPPQVFEGAIDLHQYDSPSSMNAGDW